MGKICFNLFEVKTKEDVDTLFWRKAIGFILPNDDISTLQKYIDWIVQYVNFKDYNSTYIMLYGETINRLNHYGEEGLPNDLAFIGFFRDEMENPDIIIEHTTLYNVKELYDVADGTYLDTIKEGRFTYLDI